MNRSRTEAHTLVHFGGRSRAVLEVADEIRQLIEIEDMSADGETFVALTLPGGFNTPETRIHVRISSIDALEVIA